MNKGQTTVITLVYLMVCLLVFVAITPVLQARILDAFPSVDNLTSLLLSYFTSLTFFVLLFGAISNLNIVAAPPRTYTKRKGSKGTISIPGLFVFLLISVMLITMFPFFVTLINVALPVSDQYTQMALALILPLVLIGLLVGYYRSVVNPNTGYGGLQ